MMIPNTNQKRTDRELKYCGYGFYVDADRNTYFDIDLFLEENDLSPEFRQAFIDSFQEVFPEVIIVQEPSQPVVSASRAKEL